MTTTTIPSGTTTPYGGFVTPPARGCGRRRRSPARSRAEPDTGALDLAVTGFAAGGGRPPRCSRCRSRRSGGLSTRARDTLTGVAVAPGGAGLEEVDRASLLAQHEVVVVHRAQRWRSSRAAPRGRGRTGRSPRPRTPVPPARRVNVFTSGRTWQASCHGSVVRTDAATFTARRCCSRLNVFSFVRHHHGGRGAVAVRRAHWPGVRIGDHHIVHDVVEAHLLRVRREGIERRCAWFFSEMRANSSKLVPPYLCPYSIPTCANTPGIVSVPTRPSTAATAP